MGRRIRPRPATRLAATGVQRDYCIQVKKERLTVVMDMDECMVHSQVRLDGAPSSRHTWRDADTSCLLCVHLQFEDDYRHRGLAAQVLR